MEGIPPRMVAPTGGHPLAPPNGTWTLSPDAAFIDREFTLGFFLLLLFPAQDESDWLTIISG